MKSSEVGEQKQETAGSEKVHFTYTYPELYVMIRSQLSPLVFGCKDQRDYSPTWKDVCDCRATYTG
eukprot:1062646-Amphidinium_carterae.1